MAWREAKEWSDRFLPQMKRIIGEALIVEPPIEEDMKRNTDLIVLGFKSVRVGCRVRRHEYLSRYGDEFTIRAGHPNGARTEIDKVVDGWGDYFLYGFADIREYRLERWLLGDLDLFRRWREYELKRGCKPWSNSTNGDGTSFHSFKINSLPRQFIVAQSPPPVPYGYWDGFKKEWVELSRPATSHGGQ